jgi:hypothetical protein
VCPEENAPEARQAWRPWKLWSPCRTWRPKRRACRRPWTKEDLNCAQNEDLEAREGLEALKEA